jgi:hypothetical protein
MHGAARAGRGVGIVGHHDDGFPVLSVERLEEAEDFIAGFPIEVSRGFIAKQEGGIGDNGADNVWSDDRARRFQARSRRECDGPF